MYLVFKSEVLHRREHLAKRTGNLCHGRNLPVEVPAVNPYKKRTHAGLTGRRQHISFLVLEHDLGCVEPEVLRCVHKLREMWNGKCELLEVSDSQVFEARGHDPT